MREILFRGKRTDCDAWVEGDLIQAFRGNHLSSCSIMPHTPTAYCWKVLPETVGQFTGLTDKNGKRIFEGDIVECVSDGERAVIIWVKYSAFFGLSFDGWCCGFDDYDFSPNDFKVIGNIHDNPELLQKIQTRPEAGES